MSINGEITAVHISRKSSLQSETDEFDKNDDIEEERNRYHQQKVRPKNIDRPTRGFSPIPRNKTAKKEQLLRADSDQIDLERLLHSVLDINDYDSRINQANRKGKKERPFSAHQLSSTQTDKLVDGSERRSVISEGRSPRPLSAKVPNYVQRNRTNYSFSNGTVEKIDRENQRLLKEIMRSQAKKSSSRQALVRKMEPVRAKSASALNRNRLQMQIERENLALLRRLESVKPTKDLSRDHLLREHFKQEKLSSSISRSKKPPSAGLRSKRSASLSDVSQIDRDSVISSQASVISSQKSGSIRRPISAKTHSKTKKRVDAQPVWEAGW